MTSPPSCKMRTLLQLVGMMEPKGFRLPLLYSLFSACVALSIAYCLGGCIAYIILVSGSPVQKLQSIQISIVMLNALMKHTNGMNRQQNVGKLMDDFDKIWDQLYENPLNRIIMDESSKRCNKIYKIYKFFCIAVPVLDWPPPIILYLLTGADEMSFQILIPIDHKKYFIVAQIIQSVLTFGPFMANATQSFLYYTLSEQLAAYMRVLQRMLREEDISNEIIRLHQDVIMLTNRINANYGWILFFETSTVAIECSCGAYVFCKENLIEGNTDSFIINIINLLFCYFTPFIICFCGSKVKTEGENIFREANNGNWFEQKLECKKKLRTLMLFASQPLTWHYKNLSVFGMELFLAIINGTYTFLNAILWMEKVEQKENH